VVEEENVVEEAENISLQNALPVPQDFYEQNLDEHNEQGPGEKKQDTEENDQQIHEEEQNNDFIPNPLLPFQLLVENDATFLNAPFLLEDPEPLQFGDWLDLQDPDNF
jgi:hypothetical protein